VPKPAALDVRPLSGAIGAEVLGVDLRTLDDETKAGVPASSGYTSLNTSTHVKALAANPHYQRIYGKDTMARWVERNACPVNDKLVEEAVWFSQTVLHRSRGEMERIVQTIADVQKRAGDLAKA
jgi:hypothetical protein